MSPQIEGKHLYTDGQKSPMARSKYVPLRRTDRNLIGETVARLRQQQALTQQDLAGRAAAVGWVISRDAVKRIESGEREVTDIDIKFLAQALRVPPAVLLEKLEVRPKLAGLRLAGGKTAAKSPAPGKTSLRRPERGL